MKKTNNQISITKEVTLNKMSDVALVNLLKEGSTPAFQEIVSRYTQKVHNLSMRITRNEEDTEEILQDVFVAVYKKIDKFEGKSAFSSWLYRITANTAFMKLRKRKQTPAVSLEEAGPGATENLTHETREDDITALSTRHELRAELQQAIDKLPEEYRTIFLLRDVDGMSTCEVAKILKLSVPAIKSRLHRSRLMLRKRLQNFYNDYCNEDTIFSNKSRELAQAYC